jgi:hypothetical protein
MGENCIPTQTAEVQVVKTLFDNAPIETNCWKQNKHIPENYKNIVMCLGLRG